MKLIASMGGINLIDYKSVDLNLLLSLNILLETKNVTRASEKLGVKQSTVSAQLSRLRKAFDDPLLIPSDTGRGMIVTKRAEEIYPEIRHVLKTVEQIVTNKPSFNPYEDSRTYNIASSDNGIISIGLPLVETIASNANPDIRVSFHGFDKEKIASQMERGEIDILIGSERMIPETMKARKLYDENFVLVQRKNHPRGLNTLDIDEYCKLQHVLVSIDGGGFYGCMDEHLETLGRKRRVVLSTQQFTLIPEILSKTDYVCTAPARLAQRFSHSLDTLELPFNAQGFAMYLAWHPRNDVDPAIKWLRNQIKSSIGYSMPPTS